MTTPATAYVHIPPTKKMPRMKVQTGSDGTRFYQAPNGKWYPSASTVANWEKKDFFEEWLKDPLNFAEAERAKKRGNMLHEAIERYLHNREDYLAALRGNIRYEYLFDQIKHHLGKISSIRATETPMYSDMMELAGRVDLVADFDGTLSVIDFKGSRMTKKEEWVENYLIQTTMYAIMYHERFGVPVKQVVVLIACEDGNDQVFVRDPMDYVKRTKEVIGKFRADNKEILKRRNG